MNLKRNLVKKMDKVFIDKLEINLEEINTTRIKIDTGFRCNEKCTYCYYRNNLDDDSIKEDLILKQLDKVKEFGFTEVEFSGGESSYHPDFINFIKYATKLGLRSTTLSNGTMSTELLKKAKEAGLEEIMYSFHGNEKSHEKVTKLEGSYEMIIKQLIECKKLGILTRVNYIVHKNSIDNISEVLLELQTLEEVDEIYIHQYNFLPINEWGDAEKIARVQQKLLQENYNTLEYNLEYLLSKDKEFNIRYIEYCNINEKYHRYIKNHYHHYFDRWDWHPFFMHKEDILNRKDFELNELEIKEHLIHQRASQYYKTDECLTCPHFKYCDGYKND